MYFEKKKLIKIIIIEKSDKVDWVLKLFINIKVKVVIF